MLVNKEQIKNGDVLYENDFLRIDMINPNYPFTTMKKSGSVMVPYDSHGNVYLLERKRINLGKVYELPRGFVELNELGKMGALRELHEESGLNLVQNAKAKFLGFLQPDTGVMNNKVTCYCVEVISTNDYYFKDTDEIDMTHKVIRLSKQNVAELIMNRKIADSYTLSGLFLFNTLVIDNISKHSSSEYTNYFSQEV